MGINLVLEYEAMEGDQDTSSASSTGCLLSELDAETSGRQTQQGVVDEPRLFWKG